MGKELIYSLTKKDFIVRTFRGSGPGGQKRNKTSSGVEIVHPSSGGI
jgi:protein subunit release factor B